MGTTSQNLIIKSLKYNLPDNLISSVAYHDKRNS